MRNMPFYNDIPFIGKYLKSNEFLKELTPTQIAKMGAAYHKVIGLGDNPSFSANAFKKLEEQRTEGNIAIPGAVKGPDGMTILEKTKDATDANVSNAAKAVQAQLATALKADAAFDKAQSKFKANAATFKDLVKRIPNGGFGAQDVIGTMKYYVDKARSAITTQQDLDKQHITAQFADPAFRKNLMTAYGIDPGATDTDQKIDAIKTNMEKNMASMHKKQLAAFDKSTAETFTKLHQAAALEAQKMGVVEAIKKANSDNLEMLEILAEENRKKRNPTEQVKTTANVRYDQEKAILSNVTLPNIKKFTSMTGREIKQNEPGKYTVYFPSFNPFYNQSSKQKALTDMLFIAQGLYAQGYDKIDWTIDIRDEKTLHERARQAYEASVRAGIEIENVSVRDGNGRELKLEDIFKDDPRSLAQLRQRSAMIKNEIAGLNPPEVKAFKNEDVKKAMKEIKADHLANPPAEEEEEELEEEEDKANTNSSSSPGPR